MAQNDGVAQLINAVSDDPEVKAQARLLALNAIAHARFLLAHGDPAIKARLVSSLLPAALSSMKQAPEDQDAAALKVQMAELLADMRTTGPT